MSVFYKNMENAKVEDYKTIVSNHLKQVLPLGDGIQGSKTLPFTNFIGNTITQQILVIFLTTLIQ